MVSLENLLRDNIPIWRSASDIIMTSGRDGSIPPSHFVQLIGTCLKLFNACMIEWGRCGLILYASRTTSGGTSMLMPIVQRVNILFLTMHQR
eukprot:4000518-Pyramimonas_sp.AAC.1